MRYRYYFLEALGITLFLFLIGFMIGFSIEQTRNNELNRYYDNTEDALGELQNQLDISNLGKYTCSELIERNFKIGDQIYTQALIFDKYEDSAIFTKTQLIIEHKKFDILRTLFWINSIKIKERCGKEAFDTLVYLYDYESDVVKDVAKQKVMAMITQKIKQTYPDKLILIPIAKNLNISELNLIIEDYESLNEAALIVVNEEELFLYNQTSQIRDYFNII